MSDTVPVAGVDELESHLDAVLANTSLPLNEKLFDDVGLQLSDANTVPLIPRLLPKITAILQVFSAEPTVLCELTMKLLRPLTFSQIITMTTQEAIIQALRSPWPSAVILGMAILEKAQSPSEATILGSMKDVVSSFVERWLDCPDVSVGEMGNRTLLGLLEIDCDVPLPDANGLLTVAQREPQGQGFLWRRIFTDPSIYVLLLSLTTRVGGLPERQRCLAQGRLLRVLPRMSELNLPRLCATKFDDLNRRCAQVDGNYGLLQFAALHMVDKTDELMHLILIDFFKSLVAVHCQTPDADFKTETIKKLVHDANDNILRDALLGFPSEDPDAESEVVEKLTSFIDKVV
ncbi:uncharacterized protein BCR38DRAFT_350946 [Pseudomassariella vexata]|uniref:DNA mismatch repair protein HSM3 N-terminal domain-containing protein n=1 Tax=Pseudomassariella vexata TaxID=1141098 RepID=A0A1Y2DKH3_9PEZI|nr:uncharacterized protein BCR38DRAFT_350946 [Pseudomassariella vexata]ORY59767.1 hypothetical protein BCR38DRAFT_350946 [Pseudomassariella vexata]